MGRLEGPEDELVVKRHLMMRKGKEPERNPEVVAGNVPEVEPEATCDVEMTLQ